MSKISKPAIVSIAGFILSMGMAYTNVSKPVKNACIIGGLCLIFLGVVLSRLSSSISDNKKIVEVIIVTIALCMLFAVEIHARNKVIRFVDDFCEILNIPLG